MRDLVYLFHLIGMQYIYQVPIIMFPMACDIFPRVAVKVPFSHLLQLNDHILLL